MVLLTINYTFNGLTQIENLYKLLIHSCKEDENNIYYGSNNFYNIIYQYHEW
jgi:hypothetical protein